MPLIQLIYVSDAVEPFDNEQLVTMTTKAQAANASRDITGMLIYGGGHFLQVLEGRLDNVNGLFQKIRADARHHHVELLAMHPIEGRRFSHWSMQLANMDVVPEAERESFNSLIRQFEAESLSDMTCFSKHADEMLVSFLDELGASRSEVAVAPKADDAQAA